MRPVGSMDPATARFPAGAKLPSLHDIPGLGGIFSRSVPANVTLFVALAACWLVWLLIWRTRLGYQIRAYGKSESAARYAGISPFKIIMVSMLISGALAGMMAINNVMGEAERLVLNAVEGAGFIGIAVALMGRNHPFGVFLAAILFGFLYQGGAELALETSIPRELITVIQALVILFTGALDNMVRRPVERLFITAGKEAK
jgi:simple sugar transport system permease protein